MNLYLKIENGQPVGHPVQQDNLVHAFPDIDINNLPDGWVNFTRVQPPTPGIFQKVNDWGTYAEINGVWQDSWVVTDMTQEEKESIISSYKANPPFPNAILNETTLLWDKPEKPTDGQNYLWNPLTFTWTVVSVKPDDGKKYNFNWNSMQWVETQVNPSTIV